MASLLDIAALWGLLLETPFPSCCAACEARVGVGCAFCEPCATSLVSGLARACPSCGLIWLEPPPGGGTHRCGACIRAPPPYVRACGLFAYGGALQEAITTWKNRPDEPRGRVLGQMLAMHCAALGLEDLVRPVVVPVPSAPAALARRGFNPAAALARPLARRLAADYAPTALAFRRTPASSRGLGRRDRRRRMRGVLEARSPPLRDRPVILVDDVMTTGATAAEASRACLGAGASSVHVVVLARVPA